MKKIILVSVILFTLIFSSGNSFGKICWTDFIVGGTFNSTFNRASEDTLFNIGAVNIEENDSRSPLPYRTPREIQRQQTINNQGVNLLANEQAMSFQFSALKKGDTKGAFQTFVNKDLRQFKKMQMYIHAEKSNDINPLKDKDLTAIFRIGTDFINNYFHSIQI